MKPADRPITYCKHDGINRLMHDVAAMPKAKVESLTTAMHGATEYFSSVGFESFKGSMQVEAYLGKDQQHELMLGMNVMRWLTKFYLPELVTGFKTVERLHASKVQGLLVGESYMFKPRKPMLSWTTKSAAKLDIVSRSVSEKIPDYVIRTKVLPNSVLWSYRSLDLRKQVVMARDTVRISTIGDKKLLLKFVIQLHKLMDGPIKEEREVTLYHGSSPFKALILSRKKTND